MQITCNCSFMAFAHDMNLRWGVLLGLISPLAVAAEVKVATLHPLLTDLVKQVGGDRVKVIDLLGPAGDPHKFEPNAKDPLGNEA